MYCTYVRSVTLSHSFQLCFHVRNDTGKPFDLINFNWACHRSKSSTTTRIPPVLRVSVYWDSRTATTTAGGKTKIKCRTIGNKTQNFIILKEDWEYLPRLSGRPCIHPSLMSCELDLYLVCTRTCVSWAVVSGWQFPLPKVVVNFAWLSGRTAKQLSSSRIEVVVVVVVVVVGQTDRYCQPLLFRHTYTHTQN